jgi:hypothetical protein
MYPKVTLASACACALVVALLGAATLRAETTPEPPATTTEAVTESAPVLTQQVRQRMIDAYRHQVWHWQRVMGRPVLRRLPNPPAELPSKIELWKRIATTVREHAQNPPHKRQWLCIHRFEGAWNDPNPPYYGGLQMNLGFQRTYGGGLLSRKGTADHWTPLEQMWAAERAHRSGRGFYPWPNTARYCGLI